MRTTVIWVLYIANQLIRLYSYVMLAQAVMSWFVSPMNRLYRILRMLTEPFVGLFRPLSAKLTSRMGMPIDLAFLFAVIALQLIAGLLQSIMNNMITIGMFG